MKFKEFASFIGVILIIVGIILFFAFLIFGVLYLEYQIAQGLGLNPIWVVK